MSKINPLRDGGGSGGDSDGVDYFFLVTHYLIPGMLILAIIGVILYNYSGSDATGSTNIFKDMGTAIFSSMK
jgi:hypothetical protein